MVSYFVPERVNLGNELRCNSDVKKLLSEEQPLNFMYLRTSCTLDTVQGPKALCWLKTLTRQKLLYLIHEESKRYPSLLIISLNYGNISHKSCGDENVFD
jgi:hypothetical protein